MSHRSKSIHKITVKETREPANPVNWPQGHVSVDITDDSISECFTITIHGIKHYLHATSARALSDMLLEKLDEWNREAQQVGMSA
jgi:hypothetical protein